MVCVGRDVKDHLVPAPQAILFPWNINHSSPVVLLANNVLKTCFLWRLKKCFVRVRGDSTVLSKLEFGNSVLRRTRPEVQLVEFALKDQWRKTIWICLSAT